MLGLVAFALASNGEGKNNLVLYWGQSSGGGQADLVEYCTDDVDIIALAFLYGFGNGDYRLDFANKWCPNYQGSTLLDCEKIGQDIKACQAKGKKVILSMGGAVGSYTAGNPQTLAKDIYNLFLGGTSSTRPFHDAVLDGVDLDLENKHPQGFAEFINALKALDPKIMAASAPQCVYPDASCQEALDGAPFDWVFVQFYNNVCAPPGASNVNLDRPCEWDDPNNCRFNWDIWHDWAEKVSPNKNVKLWLGTPGGASAAGSGYLGFDKLGPALDAIEDKTHFAGIMMWDAHQAFENKQGSLTYAQAAKQAMAGLA